jgi:transitional endoplasmic reticulum ATPase
VALRIRAASGGKQLECSIAKAVARRLDGSGVLRVLTPSGRAGVVRVMSRSRQSGELGVPPLLRRALRLVPGDQVTVSATALGMLTRVVVEPDADLSAFDLRAVGDEIKQTLIAEAIPVFGGLVFYAGLPGGGGGTTFRVVGTEGGSGLVADGTEVELRVAYGARSTDAMRDASLGDIGGLRKQLAQARELIEQPLRDPYAYRAAGIPPVRGVLFVGPPGTGKTLVARALANQVGAQFVAISAPELIGTGYGESEGNVWRVFSEAVESAPSIIVIDEIDAIAPARASAGTLADTRVVSQLLAQMDGLRRADGVIVVGTTNRIDAVDPALRRPGRFDRELVFDPPNAEDRHEILRIHAREMPLSHAAVAHLREIARRTSGFVGADLMELCREAGLAALREPAATDRLRAGHLTVGPRHFEAALGAVRPSLARNSRPGRALTFKDVGGLREAKRLLQLHLSMRFRRRDLFDALGLDPEVGVLLAGPSGCGKTLLVNAAAGEFGLGLLVVDRSVIHSQWFGESEEAIRDLFRQARYLAPCIVFVDDIDSVAEPRRADGRSDPRSNVLAQLMHELDRLDGSEGVVVVAATNRPDLVEPSLLRPGRFGTRIDVTLPTAAERRSVAGLSLKSVPGDLDRLAAARLIAEATAGRSGADIRSLVERVKLETLARVAASGGTVRIGDATIRRAVREFTHAATIPGVPAGTRTVPPRES